MTIWDRISEKTKIAQGILALPFVIGGIAYGYTLNIPIAIISAVITFIIITIWDFHDRITTLENTIISSKNKRVKK